MQIRELTGFADVGSVENHADSTGALLSILGKGSFDQASHDGLLMPLSLAVETALAL